MADRQPHHRREPRRVGVRGGLPVDPGPVLPDRAAQGDPPDRVGPRRPARSRSRPTSSRPAASSTSSTTSTGACSSPCSTRTSARKPCASCAGGPRRSGARPCASPSWARPNRRPWPCGPSSTPATTSAMVVTRPDKRRGRHEPPRPSPVKAAALELGLPVSDPARGRRSSVGAELGRGRGLRPDHQEGRARPPAARQRPLLAAAPVAGRGAGRAGHPGRRHHHRGVPDGDRRGPRHRSRLPLRAGGDRRQRRPPPSCGAGWPTLGASMLVERCWPTAWARPTAQQGTADVRRRRSSPPTCGWTGTGPPRSCTGWCAWAGPGPPGGAGGCWCWPARVADIPAGDRAARPAAGRRGGDRRRRPAPAHGPAGGAQAPWPRPTGCGAPGPRPGERPRHVEAEPDRMPGRPAARADALVGHRRGGGPGQRRRARTSWPPASSTPGTGPWSPSWSTAPAACSGPATGWPTATPGAELDPRSGPPCGWAPTSWAGPASPPTPRCRPRWTWCAARVASVVNAVLRRVADRAGGRARSPGRTRHRAELPGLDRRPPGPGPRARPRPGTPS